MGRPVGHQLPTQKSSYSLKLTAQRILGTTLTYKPTINLPELCNYVLHYDKVYPDHNTIFNDVSDR